MGHNLKGSFKQYLTDHNIEHKPSYPYWPEGSSEVKEFTQSICVNFY